MNWQLYSVYIYIIFPLWIAGSVFLYLQKNKRNIIPDILIAAGTLLLVVYTIQLWIHLGRPPLRT